MEVMMNFRTSNVRTRVPNSNSHSATARGSDHLSIITEEAYAWARHAEAHSSLGQDIVLQKALESFAFSARWRLHHFAVPSKLVGVSRHQQALRALVDLDIPFGARLIATRTGDEVSVYYGQRRLGAAQPKHRWLAPLLSFGATVHLIGVTGTHRDRGYWGCNIAFGHVGLAAIRLDERKQPGGHSGDGVLGDRHSGDGVSGDGLATDVPQPAEGEDVRLWRDEDGIAHATAKHVERHSPTGIEWGYRGSGPADLALSILTRFADAETAQALYQRFKAEVIARVPDEGGVIQADQVRSWLAAQQ
jgi:hypothetical protein